MDIKELKENKGNYKVIMESLSSIENLEEDEFGLGRYVTNISNRQGNYCEIRERSCITTKVADGWGDTKIEAIFNCLIDFFEPKSSINP